VSEAAGSIGQTLRAAREAQRISVEEVATRLRLMLRQVEAIEADDFDSLGQPVFARGFVRNYAKLLNLPPEELVARMGGDSAEPAVVSKAPPPAVRSWLSSPWLILAALGLLFVVLAPVALYLWLNSGDDGDGEQPFYVLPSATTPGSADSAPAAPARAVAEARPPHAAEVAPAPAETPKKPPHPPEPVAPVAAAPAASSGVLQFEFGGEAWVEIRDGSGRWVHRQLNVPGSQVEVTGQPPFDLIVGNAANVHMTYNGRPIDLRPYIEVTVARFTLE